ncbi:MAG: dTDP-4-dehydrorhamnose reductase [Verrucomicrobia bacterium]|nr:dTDP-4-dehydrorhamnose reductase [Verrucomicrobiota bacterium]
MAKRIVIVGKRGRLGAALAREFASRYDVIALGREDLDLSAPVAPQIVLPGFDAMLNCAAATNVDWCEQNPELAQRLNGEAAGELAEFCARRHARLIHVSTDYVFDGKTPGPLAEEVAPNPINRYGQSKWQGELAVLAASPDHLVVRVSWVFGPDRPSFIDQIIARAQSEPAVAAVADKWSAPSYTLDIAQWLHPVLLERPVSGILHLCNHGSCSWKEWAEVALAAARRLGNRLRTTEVAPLTLAGMKPFKASRPVHTVMATTKFQALAGLQPRPWQEAVAAYVDRQYQTA